MKKHVKLIAFSVAFLIVIFLTIIYLDAKVATALSCIVLGSVIWIKSKSEARLYRQIRLQDEMATKLIKGQKVQQIAPIMVKKDATVGGAILGEGFNELIRYIEKRELIIQNNRQMIKSVTEVIEAPFALVNANGRLDYMNDSFRRWVRKEYVKKMSYERIFNDDLRAVIADALIREIRTEGELEIKQKRYAVASSPIYNDERKFNGIAILFHDITDLTRYQNLRREFFANVSHELKTPITAIKGCTDILLSGSLDASGRAEFLTIIKAENERLEQLVQDLILINRYDTDEINLAKNEINLGKLIERAIKKTKSIAGLKAQIVTLKVTEDVIFMGDDLRLEHCFLNLITNAIHYSPEKTMIKITLETLDDKIIIKVIDEGIGIPQDDLPHIFERFYRVDKDRARHSGGTGLGLSLAKSTIEAHAGEIYAESEEGKGTTFIVIFRR